MKSQYQKIDNEISQNKLEKERNERMEKYQTDYLAYRKEKLSLPAEERAKDLNFLKLIIYDIKTTKKFIAQAIELQKKFFEEKPNRIYPDPIIFKELLGSKPLGKYMVNIIERIINQDQFWENKKIPENIIRTMEKKETR